jgi:hypothetical protein
MIGCFFVLLGLIALFLFPPLGIALILIAIFCGLVAGR